MAGFQQVDVARSQFDSKGLELAIQSMTQNLNNLYSTGTINEIGAIVAYGGAIPPTGFLLCDGSAISRATFSALFAVLGTTYGVGDGSTTFNLPDLKGRVPVGRDSGQTEFDTLGEKGGHKLMQSHTHSIGGGQGQFVRGGTGAMAANIIQGGTAFRVDNDLDSTGGGNSQNLQPYQVINYIVRYALPVTSNNVAVPYYIGQQFVDYNPLPTSWTDVPGSSITFTLTQNSRLKFNYGIRFQLNTNIHGYLRLVIDGTPASDLLSGNSSAGVVIYQETMRTFATTLASGSHTVKLQAYANNASSAVGIAPFWFADVYGT